MSGSGASFTMDFGGIDRMLGRAMSHLTGATQELMEECGEVLVTGIDEAFEKETAPDGSRWKKSKRAASDSGTTLDDTSMLRGSITHEATPDAVVVGTNDDRAVYHQQPERDGVIMPKREFIGMSDETAEELRDVLDDFMSAGFKP